MLLGGSRKTLQRHQYIIIFLLTWHLTPPLQAKDYYVHPQGSDAALGTITSPFRTIILAVEQSQPGDTIIIRGGIHRQDRVIGSWYFSHDATENARITLRGYPGEEVVVTCMTLADNPAQWTHVQGNIYSYNLSPQPDPGNIKVARISHCSQNGIPLALMTDRFTNGGPSDLTGPGQWARTTNGWKLYVWSVDGRSPGEQKTEFSHLRYGGFSTFNFLENRGNDDDEADYITLENLTIEGGEYPVEIGTDHIELRNCVFRNSFRDGLKSRGAKPVDYDNPDGPAETDYFNATYVLVEDCEVYNFRESGIDITGGDYWTVRNTRIHNENIDIPTNGIMMKNNCKGTIVEGCHIYNIETGFGGAIGIGGISWGGIAREGVDIIVKNNIMYNITGPHAIHFMAAIDSGFYNNLVYNCNLSRSVFRFNFSNDHKPLYHNKNCKIMNNLFFNNTVGWNFLYYEQTLWQGGSGDNMQGLQSNYNITSPSLGYYLDGVAYNLSQVRALGQEMNSQEVTPTFRNHASLDFRPLGTSPQVDAGQMAPVSDPTAYNPYAPNEKDAGGFARVKDGNHDGEATVDIGPFEYSNTVPVISDQVLSTDEDVPLDFTLNASDLDSDTLPSIVITDPVQGGLSGSGLVLQYQPEPKCFGTDSCQLKVNDGDLDSDIATISITIQSQNDAPIFLPQPQRVVNTLDPVS